MKNNEYTLQSKDNLSLYGQSWQPETEPKAVVCLVHGLGEHSGRYTHVAEYLAKGGYALLAFDLRGHGKSGGRRGHTPSFEAFMQDIDLFLADARGRFPDKPIFLYGHSLGGMLVLNYVLRRKPQLNGVVVTGAGLRSPIAEQKAKITFARIAGSLLPNVSMPTGLDANAVSRDPEVVQRYKDDPLVHGVSTLSMAKSGFEAIPYVFEHAAELTLPLLLMHGTADQLAYASGSQEVAKLVKGDCTLKLWEGLAHEVHNEPEKEQVLAYMTGWLDSHV